MSRVLALSIVLAATMPAVSSAPYLVAQTSPAAGAAAPALPSVALPPDLDRVLRDYERAWRAGDAAALAALFTEDGFVLQGGRPPVRGRAAIEAAYAGSGGAPLELRALAFDTAAAVGYIIGGYRYAGATSDMGKFTLTLRRAADGRWAIHSDMDNPNEPPRRPPPASSPPPPAA